MVVIVDTVVVVVTVLVVVTVVVSESTNVLVEVDCSVTVEVCTGAVEVTTVGQGVTVVSRKLEQSLKACAGPGDALLAKTCLGRRYMTGFAPLSDGTYSSKAIVAIADSASVQAASWSR